MKTLLLAYLFALLGTTAALAVPALRGDVTVNAEIVTVGDLFTNAGELSETAIFRAPAPGTTGIVPLADVEIAAKAIGLTDFDNVGYTRVRVVRASTIVDTAMLNGLINETLQQKGVLPPGVTAEPHYDLSNISFNAERVDQPVTLNDLRYTPNGGPFTARFTIAGIDQPIDLTGTLLLMTTAPRLIATTPAGTILAPTDFEIVEVPLSTASAGAYADLNQLVGKQLIRQARAGLVLKPTDVGDPTVVTRNSLVTVLFKAGAMTLTVKGQALGTASAGAQVDVLNTTSKKILHGIAQPDGTVAIQMSTTVASL